MKCRIIAFVAPLFLLSCQTGTDRVTSRSSGSSLIPSGQDDLSITEWSSTPKWWNESKPIALSAPKGQYERLTTTSASVKRVSTNSDGTTTVEFRQARKFITTDEIGDFIQVRRSRPNLYLIGPKNLNIYLSRNQEVSLKLTANGTIESVSFEIYRTNLSNSEWISWKPINLNHEIVLKPAGGQKFSLILDERQFYSRDGGKNGYIEDYKLYEKGNFNTASHQERFEFLRLHTRFEITIFRNGVACVGFGPGFGGGGFEADEEPSSILSTPSSEDFD